jgi:capsular exopolysaccharide synthesis family protein
MQSGGARTVQQDFEFRDYFRVVRRRWRLIVSLTLLIGLAGVGRSLLQDKTYSAGGSILIRSDKADQTLISTEIQILESASVRDLVAQQLPAASKAHAFPAGQSLVIGVTASAPTPQLASDTVNTTMQQYVAYKRQQQASAFSSRIDELERELASLNTQVGDLDKQSAIQPSAELDRQRAVLVSQIVPLEQQVRDQHTEANIAAPGAEIITPATNPVDPTSPKPLRDGILALIVGLFLGVGAGFLAGYLREAVDDLDDVDRATGGAVPVLATIPVARRGIGPLAALTDPASAVTEGYRTLRTSLQFAGFDRAIRSIEITSPAPGEGKTAVVANLAVLLAGTGQPVVAVDCDLRHPNLHDQFGLKNDKGLTDVLQGEPTSAALQHVPGIENLSVLSAGQTAPNPAELLASSRWAHVLATLREDALVIVDTPPSLPFTDAAVLAASLDAVVLVAAAGQTTQRQLRSAVDLMRQIDAALVGIALNMVDESAVIGYKAERYYKRVRRTKRAVRRRPEAVKDRRRKKKAKAQTQ